MCNEDGSLWVVFNGEIYNHAEIRRELELIAGHQWKTDHSDTEMILHAFEQWGIDAIHRFRVMFAIGLWDDRKHELWLIRDRIALSRCITACIMGELHLPPRSRRCCKILTSNAS